MNPLLGRWISADPLAVHGLGADLNVYAYVSGAVLKNVDPLGLEEVAKRETPIRVDSPQDWQDRGAKFAKVVAPILRAKVAKSLGINERAVHSETVTALVAQLMSESEGGQNIKNYNIGNKKAPSTQGDYYYSNTPEKFTTPSKRNAFMENKANCPGDSCKPFATGEKQKPFGVQCSGKTDCTRFRAFDSLDEGIQAFVDRVQKGAVALQDLVGAHEAEGKPTSNLDLAHTFKESTKIKYPGGGEAYYATASEAELATSIGFVRGGTEQALGQQDAMADATEMASKLGATAGSVDEVDWGAN